MSDEHRIRLYGGAKDGDVITYQGESVPEELCLNTFFDRKAIYAQKKYMGYNEWKYYFSGYWEEETPKDADPDTNAPE